MAAQPIVLIRKTLGWSTRHESGEIGRGIAALQVSACASKQAGEPFLIYGCAHGGAGLAMHDIRVCGSVNTPYQPHGEIEVAELPATELAYTIHHGSYATMQATLERLLDGILSQWLSIVSDAREVFLRHPANSGNVNEYRTELAIRVQRPA